MPRRLGLYIPWALFALFCVGWTAYWFVARDAALKALDAQIARAGTLGIKATYADVRASGYPLRLTLTLERFGARSGTLGFSAPSLPISINLSNPRHIIVGLGGGLRWRRENYDSHAMSMRRGSMSLRLDDANRLARASLDLEGVRIEHGGHMMLVRPPDTEIGKLLVHVRPDPRDGADAQLVIEATDWRGPTPVAALNTLAPYQHFRAAVVVTQSASLASRTPLASWNGALRIERFDVASARGAFVGEGELTLDAARRPEGALRAGPLTLRAADGWWTLADRRVAEARPVFQPGK
jgi:hypothetical protein